MAAPLPFFHPVCLLATWFGSGLLPKAPGTWGSLAAVFCAWPLLRIGGWPLLAIATLFVVLAGIWAAERYNRAAAGEDPGEVVIDEVAGQWIALLALVTGSPSLAEYALLALPAFIAFRLFDIWKPWPVGWLDRNLKGGLGIMMDDVAAGAYAALACLTGAYLVANLV